MQWLQKRRGSNPSLPGQLTSRWRDHPPSRAQPAWSEVRWGSTAFFQASDRLVGNLPSASARRTADVRIHPDPARSGKSCRGSNDRSRLPAAPRRAIGLVHRDDTLQRISRSQLRVCSTRSSRLRSRGASAKVDSCRIDRAAVTSGVMKASSTRSRLLPASSTSCTDAS